MLLYYGWMADNEAELTAGMAKMATSYGRLGSALIDGGNPFTAAHKVGRSGVQDDPMGEMPTGYTIIEATDLDHAVELAQGCPLVQSGPDIEALEILPAM